MKKILITGAKGQDGFILSNILAKKNYKVFGLINKNYKINNKKVKYYLVKEQKFKLIKKILNKISPDTIIHLGSENPSHNQKFTKKNYVKNLIFTKQLIDYVCEKNKIKFILASSSNIYNKSKIKIKENSKTKVSSFYSKFRLEATNYLLKRKKIHRLNASVIILFNHDSIYRGSRFLLPRLISFVKKRNYSEIKKIYKDNINGDFSHAEDICNAIYLLIKLDKNPDKIIFCSGKRSYINDIIKYFLPDIENIIYMVKTYKNKSIIGSNTKAKKLLKWKINKNFLQAAKEIYSSSK